MQLVNYELCAKDCTAVLINILYKISGGEVKTLLPKLRGQLEEMKSKVQFLELVKKYLQVIFCYFPPPLLFGNVDGLFLQPCGLKEVFVCV